MYMSIIAVSTGFQVCNDLVNIQGRNYKWTSDAAALGGGVHRASK